MIELTPMLVGVIGIVLLLVLLGIGMPVGFSMALVGIAGFAYLRGISPSLGLLGLTPYRTFANYDWTVIPLFTLMGQLCFAAGITTALYQTAHAWLGHLRGGLAIATTGACAAFGAVSGSSTAMVVAMGTVALPEMKKYRYDSSFASGCIAAAGTLASMIPPSIGLMIYGIITEQSIGRLFLAGIIPGILQAVFFMVAVSIICRGNPLLGPMGAKSTFATKVKSLGNTWIVMVLFAIVMGGIYLGVFTPNEAAAIGAFGAFVFAIARRSLSWKSFWDSILDTVAMGGMVLIILLGAKFMNSFLASSRLPFELGNIVSGLEMNRYIVLAVIVVLYLVLGCFMDTMSMFLLTLPIIFPTVVALGFNPIWFGIIINLLGEVGVITPPVGINVFVLAGIAKDIPMESIYKGITPFFIADVCLLIVLVAFPQLSLLIPSLMK